MTANPSSIKASLWLLSWMLMTIVASLLTTTVLLDWTGSGPGSILLGAAIGVVGSWYILGIIMFFIKMFRKRSCTNPTIKTGPADPSTSVE